MSPTLATPQTSPLSDAIRMSNAQGRLGLVVYTIPGFPSASVYDELITWMEKADFITIIETTIPVLHGYSDHANDVIRAAHAIGALEADDAMVRRRLTKPSLCVLYRSTPDSSSFADVCLEFAGVYDGMILEWSEPDETPYVASAEASGIELVQCVGPWMDEARTNATMANARPDGLVYLMSAEATGAPLFGREELALCIARIRRTHPDVTVAAGFGVRSPDDVRRLAEVPGLDAVIVGTQLLRQMAVSAASTVAYLEEIGAALIFPPGVRG